jgi:hypothetical protein
MKLHFGTAFYVIQSEAHTRSKYHVSLCFLLSSLSPSSFGSPCAFFNAFGCVYGVDLTFSQKLTATVLIVGAGW